MDDKLDALTKARQEFERCFSEWLSSHQLRCEPFTRGQWESDDPHVFTCANCGCSTAARKSVRIHRWGSSASESYDVVTRGSFRDVPAEYEGVEWLFAACSDECEEIITHVVELNEKTRREEWRQLRKAMKLLKMVRRFLRNPNENREASQSQPTESEQVTTSQT